MKGEAREYEHGVGGRVHDDRPYEPAQPVRAAACTHKLQPQAQTLLLLPN